MSVATQDPRKARSRGFTLMEILVALTVLAIVFAIIGQTFYTAFDSVREVRARSELQEETTLAMNRIIGDVRDARVLEISNLGTQADIFTASGSRVRYRFDVAESVAYRMEDLSAERSLLGNSIDIYDLKFEPVSHIVRVRMMTRVRISGTDRHAEMTLLSSSRIGD